MNPAQRKLLLGLSEAGQGREVPLASDPGHLGSVLDPATQGGSGQVVPPPGVRLPLLYGKRAD